MDFTGTDGNDILDQRALGLGPGSNLFARAGNDTITLADGNAEGGAGNDQITGTSAWSGAAYWSSPAAITADLSTGLVQDGYGGTDRLTDVHVLHTTWWNDTVRGSAQDDLIWEGGGSNAIDGGEGTDQVLYFNASRSEAFLSYDAVTDTITVVKSFANGATGIDLLVAVEAVSFVDASGATETVQIDDLIGPFKERSSLAIPLAGNAHLEQIVTGDFNGDGHADLWIGQLDPRLYALTGPVTLTGEESTPVQILVGNGAGGFADHTSALFDGQPVPELYFVPRVAVADFNRDGITDVFCPDFGVDAMPWPGGQNRLILSRGGALADASERLPQRLSLGHGVSVGDMDGDGRVDVLVNNSGDREGKGDELLLNDGTGGFLSKTDWPTLVQSATSSFVSGHTASLLADLDRDGNTDVVFGTWDGNPSPSKVVLNRGGALSNENVHSLPSSGLTLENVLDIEPIDLNGDALPDLVLSVTNGGARDEFYGAAYLQFLVNRGDGEFEDQTQACLPQSLDSRPGHWYKFLDVADVNGDGSSDILAQYSGASSGARLWINDGQGHFGVAREFANYQAVHLADVNADGIPEIVASTGVRRSDGTTDLQIFWNDLFVGNASGGLNFTGGVSADHIVGRSDDDVMSGRAGNDLLEGGAGTDTAVFDGPARHYRIERLDSSNWRVTDQVDGGGSDTLVDVEFLRFSDVTLDIRSPLAPVYRFAKISNGAYFYTGSEEEKGLILESYPDFRYEGVAFQRDYGGGYEVFRFANLHNGGYFYTGSEAERDATIQNYPHMRYEGSSFAVAQDGAPGSLPVHRLANITNGAYLYTIDPLEKQHAESLGIWRYEGVSFWAPDGASVEALRADDGHGGEQVSLLGTSGLEIPIL